MLSAVGIQEASSKPRPSAPRRSGSPTLIKREFSVAIPAPRNTPRIPTYGFVAGRGRTVCAGGSRTVDAEAFMREWLSITRAICAHLSGYGQSGPQSRCDCLVRFQGDLHRHTLHDFCEVTGRVVRRQQSELRAAGGSDIIDSSFEKYAGKCIHPDCRWITGTDMAYLRFFIVGLHPYIALNERNYLRSRADQLAGPHFPFTDKAAFRRRDSCIVQIDSSQRERCFLRIQVSVKQELLGIQNSTLALLRGDFGIRAAQVSTRPGQVRLAAG